MVVLCLCKYMCNPHRQVHTCDILTHQEKYLKIHESTEKIPHMATASRPGMLACGPIQVSPVGSLPWVIFILLNIAYYRDSPF